MNGYFHNNLIGVDAMKFDICVGITSEARFKDINEL